MTRPETNLQEAIRQSKLFVMGTLGLFTCHRTIRDEIHYIPFYYESGSQQGMQTSNVIRNSVESKLKQEIRTTQTDKSQCCSLPRHHKGQTCFFQSFDI